MQLGRRLRFVTHHLWTRPAVVSLRSYIGTRRATAIISFVSIVVLAACLLSIWKIYAVDKPLTQLTIMPGQDLVVSEVYVRIKHNPQGRDRLILDLKLGSVVHNRDKPILILIVPGLTRVQHGTGSNVQGASSSIPDYYRYELKENGGHAFHEEFEGNIFGKSVQELNLDFNLNVGSTTFAVEKIPQRIYVEGIGDTNVVAVYPQPTLRYPLLLGYEYTPGSGKESPNNIKMTAIDRLMIYRSQFLIFALGMIAGVFASIVATIVTEFVRDIEMNGRI